MLSPTPLHPPRLQTQSPYANTPHSTTASGFAISERRVVTNAHAVAFQTSIRVRKHGSAEKFVARVIGVCHQSDLAVLTVEDEAFWRDVECLEFGDIPVSSLCSLCLPFSPFFCSSPHLFHFFSLLDFLSIKTDDMFAGAARVYHSHRLPHRRRQYLCHQGCGLSCGGNILFTWKFQIVGHSGIYSLIDRLSPFYVLITRVD